MADQKCFKINDSEGNCLAVVIRSGFSPERTTFFSENSYSQQIGIIKYPRGGTITAHYHNLVPREVVYTQEVLVIRRGRVRVNLFNKKLEAVSSTILNEGDMVHLISGGHGFEMLDDTEMLEVKQGPYSGVSQDKTTFGGSHHDTSK